MLLTVLITIFVYSAILTVILIIKDLSSYSSGIELIDVVVGGPVAWLLTLILLAVKPIRKKLSKNKVKKNKIYSLQKVEKTTKKIYKIYHRIYNEPLWLVPQNCYIGVHETNRPSEVKLKRMRYELLEKRYVKMCLNQPDDVWKAILLIGHSVAKSEYWEIYKINTSQAEWEKLILAGCIEI